MLVVPLHRQRGFAARQPASDRVEVPAARRSGQLVSKRRYLHDVVSLLPVEHLGLADRAVVRHPAGQDDLVADHRGRPARA